MPEPQTSAAPPKRRRVPAWLKPYTDFGLYLALRFWAFVMECFPIEANLATARWFGRVWWRISPKHRDRTLANLRAAYPTSPQTELVRIARGSFQHWAQVFLVELIMSPRVLNRYSWSKYVALGDIGEALRELLSGRGAIMVTPHFGNFELLGFTLARLGIPIVAVMRPLDNQRINRVVVRRRADSGMRLLDKKGATAEVGDVLDSGVPLCFIADQDAGRKGYFVPFFGRPASTYKSIALLAMQRDLPVIVGYAARVAWGFQYRIEVERIIRPEEWREAADPALWITQQFSTAMERSIRKFPEQYLWVHRRWKTQPKARGV